MLSQIFAMDSTPTLIKKYFVYKLMGSNLFINYALGAMNMCYKLMGIRLTNFVINNSVGSIFTAGETLQTLKSDVGQLEKNKIHGVGNYVVEGLSEMDEEKVERFYQHLLESI